MSPQKVLILGAGAAGAAAARVLHGSGTVSVTLVDRTGQAPYNRTLVNKGVAIGLLTPEQVVTPAPAPASIAWAMRASTSSVSNGLVR